MFRNLLICCSAVCLLATSCKDTKTLVDGAEVVEQVAPAVVESLGSTETMTESVIDVVTDAITESVESEVDVDSTTTEVEEDSAEVVDIHEGHKFIGVMPGSCDKNKYELRCDKTIWLNRQVQVCDSVYNSQVKPAEQP